MKKCVKIIHNLYLGDMYSVPRKCDLEISVASEIFSDKLNFNETKGYFWIDNNKLYIDFSDFPITKKQIKIELVKECLDTIKQNIKTKIIYIHCVWGVNRSPSLVFIYLVLNKIISGTDLNQAFSSFKKIYPVFSMNPGWKDFINSYYPFDILK